LEAVTQQRSARGEAQGVDALGETQFDRGTRLNQGTRQYAAKEAVAKEQAAIKARAAAQESAAKRQGAVKAAKAAAARRQAAAAKSAAVRKQAAKAKSAATLAGSPRQIAQQLLAADGEGSQFACLEPLWGQESGWSVSASNPGSGAYGIPQALPGSKMGSAGPDWQTSAATQIKWGLQYIQSTYGSPCAAWSHEQSAGWY
jgi:membrane protein involved in colicin uptake